MVGLFGTACQIETGLKNTRVQLEEDNKAIWDHRLEVAMLQLVLDTGDTYLDRDAATASAVVGSRVLATVLDDQVKHEYVPQLSNENWRKAMNFTTSKVVEPPPQREAVSREQLAAPRVIVHQCGVWEGSEASLVEDTSLCWESGRATCAMPKRKSKFLRHAGGGVSRLEVGSVNPNAKNRKRRKVWREEGLSGLSLRTKSGGELERHGGRWDIFPDLELHP